MSLNFYKIVCHNSGLVYVGSTIQPIEKALQQHERDYKKYVRGGSYYASFKVIEKNNYSIHLINSAVCTDRKQRRALELLYILTENAFNKIRLSYESDEEQKKKYKKCVCVCGGRYVVNQRARHFKSSKHLNYNLKG